MYFIKQKQLTEFVKFYKTNHRLIINFSSIFFPFLDVYMAHIFKQTVFHFFEYF